MAKTTNSLAQLIDSVMTRLNFKPFNPKWSHFWNRSNELRHFKLKLGLASLGKSSLPYSTRSLFRSDEERAIGVIILL